MPDEASVDLCNEVWVLLNRVQHLLSRARGIELEQEGLSTVAAGVLFFVKQSDEPVTPGMLARFLYRQPHSVSALLTRMEGEGLVKKVRDLNRKNRVRVVLTRKGEKLAEKLDKRPVAFDALSCLSQWELINLREYLKKLMKSSSEQLRAMQPLPYSLRSPII